MAIGKDWLSGESGPGIWEYPGGDIGGGERERQEEHLGSSLSYPENPQEVPPWNIDTQKAFIPTLKGRRDRQFTL